jgi:hypothetical protein
MLPFAVPRAALIGGVLLAATPVGASPLPAPDADQVRALVRQLDDPRFAERRAADQALRRLGIGVVPQLRAELQNRPPLEVARRIELIVNELALLKWHGDLDEAMSKAERSGKPLLVFSTIGISGGLNSLATKAMEAATFDDLELVDYLNQNFVLVWHNSMHTDRFSVFDNPERYVPTYTADQVSSYAEGRGHEWTHTYFCTPDGRVTHHLAGFWKPQRYLAEARFARTLMTEVSGGLEERHEWDTARALRGRARRLEKAEENTPEQKLAQSLASGAEIAGQPLLPILIEREWYFAPYG